MKFFNTEGPIKPDIHYCVPPISRVDKEEILRLIDDQKYFVLHAPRQTGKSSCLLALVDELNRSGRYRAVYVNVEPAQAARDDVDMAVRSFFTMLAHAAKSQVGDSYPDRARAQALAEDGGAGALYSVLSGWAESSPLPICLMIDEIDAMVGDSLISVLRQLRAGYTNRPHRFPQSIVLCGVRDVRDYRIHGTREVITGGSAFNIKAESLRLGDFTPDDVRLLYGQHTAETGQRFDEAVFPLVWELTKGQPWLVNALAYRACFKIPAGRNRSRTVDVERIQEAKEQMIVERVTHLDQLADKLKEPRVRRVVQPLIEGGEIPADLVDDDLQYAVDLGLLRRGPKGPEVANAIYAEVIPRELTADTQEYLGVHHQLTWYMGERGRIDMRKLMAGFQQFFREHSEVWLERFLYKEAGPQLLMQAYLQRLVNGGGRIEREFGLGRGRTDLLILWNAHDGVQRAVVELKVKRGALETTIAKGIEQTRAYMDRCGTSEGHLVIFDRDKARTWEEKVFRLEQDGIVVWGM